MAKSPYEQATSEVDYSEDVVLFSADTVEAYFDPWGLVEKLQLQ